MGFQQKHKHLFFFNLACLHASVVFLEKELMMTTVVDEWVIWSCSGLYIRLKNDLLRAGGVLRFEEPG